MKAEYALEEIRSLIKRNEKNNRLKTMVFIVAGMAVVVGAIVFIVSKFKGKDDFSYDDWSELDDMDYDDFDDFDDYDYDYEDEDFDMEDAGEVAEEE